MVIYHRQRDQAKVLSYWREWVPQAASKAWWCAASRASPLKSSRISPSTRWSSPTARASPRACEVRAEPGADSRRRTPAAHRAGGRWILGGGSGDLARALGGARGAQQLPDGES